MIGNNAGAIPEQSDDSDEDEQNSEDEEYQGLQSDARERVTRHQQSSIRHDALPVPSSCCPFLLPEQERQFEDKLDRMREAGLVPSGFNLTNRERAGKPYPSVETIPGRLRGSQRLSLQLPIEVWKPRALLWAQALLSATEVLESIEDE